MAPELVEPRRANRNDRQPTPYPERKCGLVPGRDERAPGKCYEAGIVRVRTKMRFGSVTFATVPSVGVALALVAGGCGGIYRDSGEPDGGSGGRHSGVGSGGRVAT